jgi:hypothetical protein
MSAFWFVEGLKENIPFMSENPSLVGWVEALPKPIKIKFAGL